MGVRGIGSCIKYSMFLFNAVILVIGVCQVGFGIYIRTSEAAVTKFSSILGSGLLPTTSLTMIVSGAVIIIVSFLGCCGAIKEVKCMLIMYFVILLLLFICMVVGGVLFYVFKEKIETVAVDHLKYQVNELYGKPGEESVTETWDSVQKSFDCCGVKGDVDSTTSLAIYKLNSDWVGMQYYLDDPDYIPVLDRLKVIYVPLSCCKDPVDISNVTKCQGASMLPMIPGVGPPIKSEAELNDQLRTEGCFTRFMKILIENKVALIAAYVCIAVAMILGMVFSICLCRKIWNVDYYDECD